MQHSQTPWQDEPYDMQLVLKLKRIYRLSHKPPNPSFAYRHLEDIAALTASILEEMGASSILQEMTTLDTDQEQLRALWHRSRRASNNHPSQPLLDS